MGVEPEEAGHAQELAHEAPDNPARPASEVHSCAYGWAAPSPLEGVKSRKRPIFSIEAGEVSLGGDVSRISSVRITLQSRIVARGEAGRALVELLLGDRQLKLGKPHRHAGLVVAHLGPHLSGADKESDEAQHVASIEAELERRRPHIVVLDEARSMGNVSWARAFMAILASPTFCAFRGATVVACSSAAEACTAMPLIEDVCSERWLGADGWLWQESIAGDALHILEDVLSPCKDGGVGDVHVDVLLQGVRELSRDCFFGEDSVAKAQDREWALSLLVKAPEDGGERKLCGFICVRWPTHSKPELHIARLAVPKECRSCGHGQRLMQWVLRRAARLPQSVCPWISLSALDTAVPFYEKYGFVDMTADDIDDPEHLQTWMELKNRSRVPEQFGLEEKPISSSVGGAAAVSSPPSSPQPPSPLPSIPSPPPLAFNSLPPAVEVADASTIETLVCAN